MRLFSFFLKVLRDPSRCGDVGNGGGEGGDSSTSSSSRNSSGRVKVLVISMIKKLMNLGGGRGRSLQTEMSPEKKPRRVLELLFHT